VTRVALAVAVLLALGIALAVALTRDRAPAPETTPAPAMLVGFLDDVSFRWHPERAAMLDRAQATGAKVVRAFIRWHLAAPERPAPGEPPFVESHLWELDELVAGAEARGMEVLFTIWGTPPWANGGQPPNRAPTDPEALRAFAHGLASRFPSVRRYAIWNEPNTELFLAPQFDDAGNSVAPEAYAAIYRAAREGIVEATPEALVAAGETSSHGRDAPSPGDAQETHSPVRFARLLSELAPPLELDAWAHHPYPVDPDDPPDQEARWPAVTLTSLERFGEELDALFGRKGIPLWVTEFGYEASPPAATGVLLAEQAAYAAQALALASAVPRVELFVWFTFQDQTSNDWQSGLLDLEGNERPAYRSFSAAVRALDGERRHPASSAGP
jgi:hypothetical protein